MRTTVRSGDTDLAAYLAVPQPEVAGPGPWPGVVIVHDAMGLGDDARSIADRFATAGYTALVPDLYGRGGLVRCVRTVFSQLRAGSGQAFDDIEAARRQLASREDATGRVGVVGFCMGGGFALLTAARGFDVSAPYYGMSPATDDFLDGACPIVASFGKKDPGLRGAAARLEKALTERDIPHDVKEYPDAGHGCANRLSVGPFGPIMRLANLGYHHESAEDAWHRVFAFFAHHLKQAAPES
jgi:carboxymethylenebutenolidase